MAKVDEFDDEAYFLAASQQLDEQEKQLIEGVGLATTSKLTPASSSNDPATVRVTRIHSARSRFAVPVTDEELRKVVEALPEKTRQQTKWAVGIWMNWRLHRIKIAKSPDESPSTLTSMGKDQLSRWLSKFIVEKSPTLAQLCTRFCGVQRYLREQSGLSTDFFSDPEFHFLKSVLDSQMKAHRGQGIGCKKNRQSPLQLVKRSSCGTKGC